MSHVCTQMSICRNAARGQYCTVLYHRNYSPGLDLDGTGPVLPRLVFCVCVYGNSCVCVCMYVCVCIYIYVGVQVCMDVGMYAGTWVGECDRV